MVDIEYLSNIINANYLQTGDMALTMVEPEDEGNGLSEQRITVRTDSHNISSMKLYCFNTHQSTPLLPFFNQNTVEPNKSPKGLTSFCDYILLVQHAKGLFVFLLEMKRGTKEGAGKQLEASRLFFDYVLNTADRIKEENSYPDFSADNISFRTIILQEASSPKRITKPKEISEMKKEELESVLTYKCTHEFRPIEYCR